MAFVSNPEARPPAWNSGDVKADVDLDDVVDVVPCAAVDVTDDIVLAMAAYLHLSIGPFGGPLKDCGRPIDRSLIFL